MCIYTHGLDRHVYGQYGRYTGANSVRAVLDTSECLAALKSFPALTLSLSARRFTGALFSPRLDDDEAETS